MLDLWVQPHRECRVLHLEKKQKNHNQSNQKKNQKTRNKKQWKHKNGTETNPKTLEFSVFIFTLYIFLVILLAVCFFDDLFLIVFVFFLHFFAKWMFQLASECLSTNRDLTAENGGMMDTFPDWA